MKALRFLASVLLSLAAAGCGGGNDQLPDATRESVTIQSPPYAPGVMITTSQTLDMTMSATATGASGKEEAVELGKKIDNRHASTVRVLDGQRVVRFGYRIEKEHLEQSTNGHRDVQDTPPGISLDVRLMDDGSVSIARLDQATPSSRLPAVLSTVMARRAGELNDGPAWLQQVRGRKLEPGEKIDVPADEAARYMPAGGRVVMCRLTFAGTREADGRELAVFAFHLEGTGDQPPMTFTLDGEYVVDVERGIWVSTDATGAMAIAGTSEVDGATMTWSGTGTIKAVGRQTWGSAEGEPPPPDILARFDELHDRVGSPPPGASTPPPPGPAPVAPAPVPEPPPTDPGPSADTRAMYVAAVYKGWDAIDAGALDDAELEFRRALALIPGHADFEGPRHPTMGIAAIAAARADRPAIEKALRDAATAGMHIDDAMDWFAPSAWDAWRDDQQLHGFLRALFGDSAASALKAGQD